MRIDFKMSSGAGCELGAPVGFWVREDYNFQINAMNCDIAGRRVARTSLIPLFLIVVGIFVWGVRYKLSLYDSPGCPSRSIAAAKLLSPNERPGSVQTASQIRSQCIPSPPPYSRINLIATVFFGMLPVRLVRANAVASPDAQYTSSSVSCFFSFRPPPDFIIV